MHGLKFPPKKTSIQLQPRRDYISRVDSKILAMNPTQSYNYSYFIALFQENVLFYKAFYRIGLLIIAQTEIEFPEIQFQYRIHMSIANRFFYFMLWV